MTSTFATLRALHLVISDALDDIQRVFLQQNTPPPSPDISPETSPFTSTPPTSFPPTPLSATFPPPRSPLHIPSLDYPSPHSPFISDSPSEQLALHPDAVSAASKIVAACGQISNIVHKPFLSLCDAIMSYNLPACMRFVEHLHVAEIIREAEENKQRLTVPPLSPSGTKADPSVGPSSQNPLTCDLADLPTVTRMQLPDSRIYTPTEGLHIADIVNVICSYAGDGYVDPSDLVHALRLLSTHHIFRETCPDTFALTRVASLLDTGKSVKAVFSNPETKYDDTDGIPAFVALVTDELFKSAAYLTEAFTGVRLPTSRSTPSASSPFNEGTITPPTSRHTINDLVLCAPTTRSSNVLSHTAYPDDSDIRPLSHSLPSAQPPESVRFLHPPTDSLHSQPLNVHQAEKENRCLRFGDTTKPEKVLAFNLAFHTHAPFFEWLENRGEDPLGGTGQGARMCTPTRSGRNIPTDLQSPVLGNELKSVPGKPFRLERFSKAMTGTTGWEAPKAILSGFDWQSLPKGSTIVDVGGGIGSTTMTLARALNDHRVDSVKTRDGAHSEVQATFRDTAKDAPGDNLNLRFVVQDRPVVTALGIEAWRSKCPEILDSGQVLFHDQDFFEPQRPFEPPHLSKHPAVYILRVVLHDWPDEFARRILINLRAASDPETRLLIAEHVLPLACIDEDVFDLINTDPRKPSNAGEWTVNLVLAHIEGAERTLVPPPLIPNLGKASANAYWMDLTMHITLNGKERTLREFCALALSAGWRVTRMTRPEGSLFAYLVCEPIPLPDDAQAIYNAIVLSSELSAVIAIPSDEPVHHSHIEALRYKRLPEVPLLPSAVLERSSSRCGTPTFGSRILLPKDEELQGPRTRGVGVARKWLKSKGLGVRSVMMQKVEKQKEKGEQNLLKGASARDNDAQNVAPGSSSHVRVWWKKSPPNSASNSSTEPSDEIPPHQVTRRRKGTNKSNDNPATPSPRISPAHQKWPSIESVVLPIPEASPPVPHTRRPSVASITRKLSFATFRRPSIVDIIEPLPTPPPSATLTELAPPPTLHGDTGRTLKHLPSLPTLGRNEVVTSITVGQSAIPRRPSLSLASYVPSPQSMTKPALPRRPDVVDSSKSGILKSRTSPSTSKQNFPNTSHLAEATSIPQRQRRVTLSTSPGAPPPRTQVPTAGNVNVPPDPIGSEVRRIPGVPKIPRRLSIPMLRRKQSESVIKGGEKEG